MTELIEGEPSEYIGREEDLIQTVRVTYSKIGRAHIILRCRGGQGNLGAVTCDRGDAEEIVRRLVGDGS